VFILLPVFVSQSGRPADRSSLRHRTWV